MYLMNGRISRLLLLASSAGLAACATVERPVAPIAAPEPPDTRPRELRPGRRGSRQHERGEERSSSHGVRLSFPLRVRG